jgi:pheromone shutdown-related protein TraB
MELPPSVTTLVRGDTTYYLVGTAHVSKRSIDDVRATIEAVRPDVVCVELDKTRRDALTKDSAFRDLDVIKVIREGKTLYLLGHLALAAYQRRIGARLGVKPGAELLAAIEVAREHGVPVELIDRDIAVTLKRTWRNVGMWKRALLVTSLVVGFRGKDKVDVEELKEPKALSEMLSELARVMPEVKAPLIDERDAYMMSRLLEVGAGKRSVVAVVGAAHVPGMLAVADLPIDRAPLERVPEGSRTWRAIKWLVPLAFIGGLVWAWSRSESVGLAHVMLAWILPTSIASAGMTLLVGGTLATALSAVFAAPIAAIHPLFGTGLVTGLVEAWRRRPNVADCERLPEDIQSFKGFRRNPVTRILLVVIASQIGTFVGFWFGVGWVATLL